MIGFGAPTVVEGQPRAPLPYGIFSVLTLRNASDLRWTNGVEWEGMTCEPAQVIQTVGCPEDGEEKVQKDFADLSTRGAASSFVVIGSAKCGGPAGTAISDAEERATAHLLAREEQGVESVFYEKVQADTSLTSVGSAATSPEAALALAEGWLASEYGSLGVIHGSRQAISLLSKRVRGANGVLTTRLGTPVVASTALPFAADATSTTLYVTPALFGYRGSVFTSTAYNTGENNMFALAERQYVVGYDPCGVAAVQMEV